MLTSPVWKVAESLALFLVWSVNLLLGGTESFWLNSFQFPFLWGTFYFPFDFIGLFCSDGPATFTEFISISESASSPSSPSLFLTNNKSVIIIWLFYYFITTTRLLIVIIIVTHWLLWNANRLGYRRLKLCLKVLKNIKQSESRLHHLLPPLRAEVHLHNLRNNYSFTLQGRI